MKLFILRCIVQSHSFRVSVYSCSYQSIKNSDGNKTEQMTDNRTNQLVTVPMTDLTGGKCKYFLFWLCYKRNGKRFSCATIELWMPLGGLLSAQEATIVDKSLGTLLRFRGVFQFTQVQPLPSPYKQCWTRVSRIFY